MIQKSFLDNAPTLFIQTGKEQSALFAMNFARDVRHFVLRLTGGCGLMTPADAIGLKNLEDALAGGDCDGSPQPKFSGFGIFGGTRMLNTFDPSVVVPGVTEVFPKIASRCPGAVFLGVVAKIGILRYTPFGVVLSEDQGSSYFTVMHPEQHSIVLIQPTSDARASYEDEYKECVRICAELNRLAWQSLLVVYNGGSVTEKELLTWAKLGQQDPEHWKVLLIGGSGRTADKYANDQEFLSDHPTVHVAGNTSGEIRQKFFELGAITYPPAEQEACPFVLAG